MNIPVTVASKHPSKQCLLIGTLCISYMVRPIKTLLLNAFGRELFEYTVGHYYYFIISSGKFNIGGC